MHNLALRLDEYGKGAWIAALVAAFWLFWPVGLAILGYLMFSGRLRAWRGGESMMPGRWYNAELASCGGRRRRGGGRFAYAPSSGNAAFDDYRAETLRRLEEEQREFVEYLERLRKAKDRQEFEQFMAERTRRPGSSGNGDKPVDNV